MFFTSIKSINFTSSIELQIKVSWYDQNLNNWKIIICGALRDLVLCAQFKKREKHPEESYFSKVAG